MLKVEIKSPCDENVKYIIQGAIHNYVVSKKTYRDTFIPKKNITELRWSAAPILYGASTKYMSTVHDAIKLIQQDVGLDVTVTSFEELIGLEKKLLELTENFKNYLN
jgi:hypothetical protein